MNFVLDKTAVESEREQRTQMNLEYMELIFNDAEEPVFDEREKLVFDVNEDGKDTEFRKKYISMLEQRNVYSV